MCSLSKMKKICNTVIVQQYFYGGISVYSRAEKNRRLKFLRFLFSHTLYILFFVGIGTNSSFNCIPNPCASFFTILRLGFLVPFSIRLISACVIPVLADKSFCVIFCCTLLCIIHLEPPVFDCFVYIRQDATQSYLEVLFYSIGAFNELQECSFLPKWIKK